MGNYAIYTTESFDRDVLKLSFFRQRRIKKIFMQLKKNPYVGNQLKYKFLREKRIKEKRIYYLVYDNLNAVLIVAISGKKTQQETIDYIIKYLDEYGIYLKKLLGN